MRDPERPLILLVEDDEANQRIEKLLLEQRGYRVDVADDGDEAIAATARTPYAAVLMDCQMPRVDGYAATRAIRARDASSPRVPVIAMTASAEPGARERCVAAGMDDYVTKPIHAEALFEVLQRWAPLPEAPPAPPPRAPSSPAIDLGMLEKLRAGQRESEPDIVIEVATLFLRDATPRISAIRAAVAAGDLAAAARTVHALKGSAGHLGAKILISLCARFEDKVRAGAAFDARFAVQAIEDELRRVTSALTKKTGVR
jgi:CheY-like chemotaxis protein/HPt (histidine-containing phosphotransfer) domain-containing protein